MLRTGQPRFGSSLPFLSLLAATCCVVAAQEGPRQPSRGIQQLLKEIQASTAVSSAQELLLALNSSAGSSAGELITLTGDILLLPADTAAFQPWLPLDCGNRTLVLAGAKPGTNQPVLDFGGAVGLLYHPAGHSFFAYNLQLQGLASAAAGIAAGIRTQMVGGPLWPTMMGEPGHVMGIWNSTIRVASPTCGPNSTRFTVSAVQQMVGRSDAATLLNDTTYFVGLPIQGSFALRIIDSGEPAGSVRWSWDNTTVSCFRPDPSAEPLPAPSPVAEAFPSAANHSATTGVAGSGSELLALLASPGVSRILLGAHIDLHTVDWQSYKLPLVLSACNVLVESSDDLPKVLALGDNPELLYLSRDSSLAFSRLFLQGMAPPSAAITSRTDMVVGSPLWPTVDGEAGHQLLFYNCTMYVTPCSRNSTEITKGLLRKMLGDAAVLDAGDTAFLIATHFVQPEPIRSITTSEQVGVAPYTFDGTVIGCQEDPAVGLAAQLQAEHALPSQTAGSQPPSEGGGTPAWLIAAAAAAAAAGAGLVGLAGLLTWRRRRRRRRQVKAEAAVAAAATASVGGGQGPSLQQQDPPITPRTAKTSHMESGDLTGMDDVDKLQPLAAVGYFGPDSKPSDGTSDAASGEGKLSASSGSEPFAPASSRDSSESAGSGKSADESCSPPSSRLQGRGHGPDALWRIRFGVIDGLDVGELLGRGAYGRVYKGRWNGVVVAVKVVEHRVSGGETPSLSREPLLCMSVSHPNCISTYKLSVIRLLRGHDLLPSEDSEELASPAANPRRLSIGTDDTAMHGGNSPSVRGRQRLLRSLLSGAEAVEVEDPYGPLQPGLYETWIVSERGTLGDAIAEKRLLLPDGRPHMVSIYLCLLDIAAGMQYLHSMGIMHSDLKPANVLLKATRNSLRGFSCKLADFGLSRMLGWARHPRSDVQLRHPPPTPPPSCCARAACLPRWICLPSACWPGSWWRGRRRSGGGIPCRSSCKSRSMAPAYLSAPLPASPGRTHGAVLARGASRE
ncbi:hypothetical protein ABPG77_010379, partial [Micractinium sp. CCAP 211/92]